MADYLVIVESPSKAKNIGRFLGSRYKVDACVGHLRDLPASKLSIDIDNGFEPQYANIRGKSDIIKMLRDDAGAAKKVLIATDPDREGEAIAWHLEYLLGIDNAQVCRVTFQEITKKVVQESVKTPRTVDLNLVNAYQARRVLDRLVGYEISPVLWRKVKKGLSAGRVQSVVLRLICDREAEIDAFKPKEYWNVTAKLSKITDAPKASDRFEAKYYGGADGKKKNLASKADADKVLEDVKNGTFTVKSVKNTSKKRPPAPPFITSTLQQEASRRLNFPSAKTMSVVQSLYEGVAVDASGATGLVTYIRTDSTRVSEEAQDAARQYIAAEYGEKYLPGFRRVYKNKNSAQDAHEAIRPTHIDYTPDKVKARLTSDQYRLYKLIYERFIASQMADAVFDVCNVDILAGTSLFKASGSTPVFPGYTKVYEERQDQKTEAEGKLPKLSEDEILASEGVEAEQHFTEPPSRYTEASLIKTLTDYGIGRPSTYAQIISVVFTRDYVVREKKLLIPTELGKTVNTYLNGAFPNIVDVSFTAGVEEQLDKVAQGERQWKDVISEFYGGLESELKKALDETARVKVPDEVSDVVCDKCGRMMVYKQGRNGRFLACPGFPSCRNTKSIVENVGVNCPECGKPLIYRHSKTGKKYISCSGYPECKFISWNVPTGEKCPKCGKHLEYVYNKSGKRFVSCSNKECDYKQYGRSKRADKKDVQDGAEGGNTGAEDQEV